MAGERLDQRDRGARGWPACCDVEVADESRRAARPLQLPASLREHQYTCRACGSPARAMTLCATNDRNPRENPREMAPVAVAARRTRAIRSATENPPDRSATWQSQPAGRASRVQWKRAESTSPDDRTGMGLRAGRAS